MTSVLHNLIALFLVIGIPLWDRRETHRLRDDPSSARRVHSYQKTIGWLWGATALLVASTPWPALLVPPPASGWLASLAGRPEFAGVAAGFIGALAVGFIAPIVIGLFNDRVRARFVEQLRSIWFFLPHSPRERRWFVAVCISAGVCEEIIYRGFLLRYLAAGELPVLHVPLVVAIVIAGLIFGLGHGYQGWVGIAGTAVIGIVLSFLFVLAGHLWPAIVIHTLLDLRILLVWPVDGSGRPAMENMSK